ncbi:MAG: phytanoyl-CoA dioxygenase family protein [Microvirga sp.]|nr:phytanoyl-CoA dioxygenase family protein [Microvirga sp.]
MLETEFDTHRAFPSLEDDFAVNGVATLRGLLDPGAVDDVRRWLRAAVDEGGAISPGFEAEFEPGTDTPRKLRRLYWNDEAFWRRVFADAHLPQLAERLVGAPVGLTFHAAFLKPAEVGTQVALHQDQALWKYDYPNAVSIWIALTPAKRRNGCLIGCPGSHDRGEIAHVDIPDHPWHPGIDWRAEGLAEPVPYELDPGDALVWHRNFVHGSGPNLSAEPRWGVVMVFVDRTQPGLRATDRADF